MYIMKVDIILILKKLVVRVGLFFRTCTIGGSGMFLAIFALSRPVRIEFGEV